MSPFRTQRNALGLPHERSGRPATTDLEERRQSLLTLSNAQIFDDSVVVKERMVGHVSCIDVAGRDSHETMIYVHGGGFRMGRAELWVGLASRLSVASHLRVILPNYRLAPEHPFPNALHDLLNVYISICVETNSQVYVGGDSAGGGLACSLALHALAGGAQPAAGAVLISPWLDLTVSAGSYSRNAKTDGTFSQQSALEAAQQYLQGVSASHRHVSPLLGNWEGFPPTILFASETEVLIDDTTRLIKELTRVGTVFEAHTFANMPHVWPILAPSSPETAATIELVGRFIRTLNR